MAGVLPTLASIILFGLIAAFSQKIATDCAVEAGKESYQDAVLYILGPAYSYVVQIMQVILTFVKNSFFIDINIQFLLLNFFIFKTF